MPRDEPAAGAPRPRGPPNYFTVENSVKCAADEVVREATRAARNAAKHKRPRTDRPAGNGKEVDTKPDFTATDIRRSQEMLQSTEDQHEAMHELYDHAVYVAERLQNEPKDPVFEKLVHTAWSLVNGIDVQLDAREAAIEQLKTVLAKYEGRQPGYPDAQAHNANLGSVERAVDLDSRQRVPVQQIVRDDGGLVVDDEQLESFREMRRLQSELDQTGRDLTRANEQHTAAWEWYLKIDAARSSLLLRIEELEELKEKCTAGTSGSQANGSASGGRAAGGSA